MKRETIGKPMNMIFRNAICVSDDEEVVVAVGRGCGWSVGRTDGAPIPGPAEYTLPSTV